MHAHTRFIAQGRALKAHSLSANISAQTPSSGSVEGAGGDSTSRKQNTRISLIYSKDSKHQTTNVSKKDPYNAMRMQNKASKNKNNNKFSK